MSFTSEEARLLLRNKFVVVLGDSIQRTVYKDLVLFLQKSNYLTDEQLRAKCEPSFEGDCLLKASKLTNGTDFREARQFCHPFHLLRFHFLTRVYSADVEEILKGFQTEPLPDILIINSCVWDISRYGKDSKAEYWRNLKLLFMQLRDVLPNDCLVIWSLAMPLGSRLKGGFLPPEHEKLDSNLRIDVVEANFCAANLAAAYNFDVLDLHFRFRRQLGKRAPDGIHWNECAHRAITQLLLCHIAEAWGICLPRQGAPVPASRGVGPRGSHPLRWDGAVENHFTSDLTESCMGYLSFRDAPGPEVPASRGVGPRGSHPLRWDGAVENHFTSDLTESCMGYLSFRDAPGPEGPPPFFYRRHWNQNVPRLLAVHPLPSEYSAPDPRHPVPWHLGGNTPLPFPREVGARGSAPHNLNYFRSELCEPCPPPVRFGDHPGPDGPAAARAFDPFSQAMDDPQSLNLSWRLVCNRRVMRRRVNQGRTQEPYRHSSAHRGRCRPAYSGNRGFSHRDPWTCPM